MRYVDRDEDGCALVGVIRHGARGWFNRHGLPPLKWGSDMWPGRATQTEAGRPKMASGTNDTTDPISNVARALSGIRVEPITVPNISVSFVRSNGEPAALTPLPWYRRFWLALVAFFVVYVRVSDPDWHHTIRDTAISLLMWSFTATAIAIFGKALFWVMML